ncbi:MAG: hypothetical protein ABI182_00255 [Candidatus Baltobacteraceae bacterium]
MDEYIIGSGAMLAVGTQATITRTKVHAEVRGGIAARARAVAIDFESVDPGDLQRLLILAAGWQAGAFQASVTGKLLQAGVCGIGEVFRALSTGTGQHEVHLFAYWNPHEVLTASLRREGIELVAHPLGEIRRAALIAEQAYTRWELPPQAA